MRVDHTALWVSDPERTFAFYEGVLGMERRGEFEFEGTQNYVVADEDGVGFQFRYDPEGESEIPAEAGPDHVGVYVDDVDARVADCEAAGRPVVRAPETVEHLGRRVAFVEDPDGYLVEFVQVV